MPNLKLAQRSAAFKGCRLLYDKNELDDNLMPTNGHRFLLHINKQIFQHWKSSPFKEGIKT